MGAGKLIDLNSHLEFRGVGEDLVFTSQPLRRRPGDPKRPKLDRHDSHFFLICSTVSTETKYAHVVAKEIDAFIGDRWLVAVRADEDVSIAPVVQRSDLR